MNESTATAIGHLEMICQAATGDYSLKPGELEKRKAAILAYLRTGQCVAGAEDKLFAHELKRRMKGLEFSVTDPPGIHEGAQPCRGK